MPDLLYHATFNAYLDDILQKGLLADSPNCNWEGLSRKVVCLCTDPDDAISFCEAADSVGDDVYYSGIVVLEINVEDLDPDLLFYDSNILDENSECFEYCGDVIPSSLHIH